MPARRPRRLSTRVWNSESSLIRPFALRRFFVLHIQLARDQLLRPAVALLLRDAPADERDRQLEEFLDAARSGSLTLDGLLVAVEHGFAVGAVYFALQPDGCAFVWPPRADGSVDVDGVCDALLQDVGRRLDACDCWLGQSIVEPEAAADRAILERNGFAHLADLQYLRRPLRGRPTPAIAQPALQVVRLDPDEAAERFGSLIDRTYRQSADCPALSGLRTGVEAVGSHKATGACLPDQWLVFQHRGEDAGLLIFADHADQDAWELVYMGVVPESRGRGFGCEIVSHGLQAAARSGRSAVLLAVDGNNVYARRVYEAAGFERIDAKSIHIRPGTLRRTGR